MLLNVQRLIQTVRHLRTEQIAALIKHRLRQRFERPDRWDPGPAPEVPTWRRGQLRGLSAPASHAQKNLTDGIFRFAGEEHKIGWLPDWSDAQPSLLWRYNLHYFEWLWDLPLPDKEEVVRDWITHNPLQKGAVGWDPYPISLRLQNWILGIYWSSLELSEDGQKIIWESLWKQAKRLEERLEFHLMANHLFENAATLALLGATFEGSEGARWKERGGKLLAQELEEQILEDGMHCERSPMYHSRVCWLLEMLQRCPDSEVSSLASSYSARANEALEAFRHPDGSLALFNDAGHGIYALPAAKLQSSGAWSLPNAGYYGFRSENGDRLICDAGHLGPDYQPGHAHADCLSFELSLKGQRVITDTGVSDYGVTETRRYVRSTAAHNTVEIGGQDQAELWGAFRVGRRWSPQDVEWRPKPDGLVLSASHDGYRRMGVTHRREFSWQPDLLKITDDLVGKPCRAVTRLHFAPEIEVSMEDEDSLVANWASETLRIEGQGSGKWTLSKSPFYDQFGQGVERVCAAYELESPGVLRWAMLFTW